MTHSCYNSVQLLNDNENQFQLGEKNMKMKGRFLGQPAMPTKKETGYIRKFLCGDRVFTVFSKTAAPLDVVGDVEIDVDIQDFVFIR